MPNMWKIVVDALLICHFVGDTNIDNFETLYRLAYNREDFLFLSLEVNKQSFNFDINIFFLMSNLQGRISTSKVKFVFFHVLF